MLSAKMGISLDKVSQRDFNSVDDSNKLRNSFRNWHRFENESSPSVGPLCFQRTKDDYMMMMKMKQGGIPILTKNYPGTLNIADMVINSTNSSTKSSSFKNLHFPGNANGTNKTNSSTSFKSYLQNSNKNYLDIAIPSAVVFLLFFAICVGLMCCFSRKRKTLRKNILKDFRLQNRFGGDDSTSFGSASISMDDISSDSIPMSCKHGLDDISCSNAGKNASWFGTQKMQFALKKIISYVVHQFQFGRNPFKNNPVTEEHGFKEDDQNGDGKIFKEEKAFGEINFPDEIHPDAAIIYIKA